MAHLMVIELLWGNSLVELPGNLSPGDQGKLFMSRNLTGGTKLQNCHRSVSREAAGLWMLLITIHIRSRVSMGEAVHISRV